MSEGRYFVVSRSCATQHEELSRSMDSPLRRAKDAFGYMLPLVSACGPRPIPYSRQTWAHSTKLGFTEISVPTPMLGMAVCGVPGLNRGRARSGRPPRPLHLPAQCGSASGQRRIDLPEMMKLMACVV